jgi:DNA-binding NarL/FixJ family response regulator
MASAPDLRQPPPLAGQPLSTAEVRALTALARGWRYADIAIGFPGGLQAVKDCLRHAYRKLGATTAAQAIALAIATGQLPAGVAVQQPHLCDCGEQDCVHYRLPPTPAD